MARPTLTGQTKRMSRRQDGKLDSISLIPPPEPPVETGGPYVVATTGDWIEGNTVTIQTDDVRFFGENPGTVWLCNEWKWGRSSVKVQQTVLAWTNESITIQIVGDPTGKFLMVRDANSQPVRFCLLEGRAVRRRKLGIGVNIPWLNQGSSTFALCANVVKHADAPTRSSGTGSVLFDDRHARRAIVNIAPGMVIKWHVLQPREPAEPTLLGKYVVRWEGEAECAWGTASSVLTSWSAPGSTPIYNYPPVGNDRTGYLYFRNNTSSTINIFIKNVVMVRIDHFAGATDADKAAAALASWDAGVANLDHRLFNPFYLALLKDTWGVKGIRLMDPVFPMGSRATNWENCQVPVDSLIWVGTERFDARSVPFEVEFALAKALDVDYLYTCLPGGIGGDFWDNYAQCIIDNYGDQLNAGKKLFLERSNEVWNWPGIFRVGGLIVGGAHFRNSPELMCVRDPVTGKYTCDQPNPFSQPFHVVAMRSSNPSTSLAIYSYSTSQQPWQASTARNLLVTNIVDGQFDIFNPGCSRNVTDDWVTLLPYDAGTGGTPATWAALNGVVSAQADTFTQLRARLPASMYANIPKFIASQGSNNTMKLQMERWADKHLADLGPLEIISVAPYYEDNATATYINNNPGEYWRTFQSGVAWADAKNTPIATDPTSEGTRNGGYIVNNWRLTRIGGFSFSGWKPQIWCYEGGNHMLAGKDTEPHAQAAADSPEGGELMRYWLRTMAATDAFDFVWHYVDVRESIFGIRINISDTNPGRDALMTELQGEI
jgi:hypothetical protein